MYSQPELSAQGVKYIGITFPHMVQFKGKVRTLMMKTQQREDKLFILSMVLWGLVQVTCGRTYWCVQKATWATTPSLWLLHQV